MSNIAKHSLEDIKLYMICILSGRADREHVLSYLCALSDFSGISDDSDWDKKSDLTATVFFVNKSMEFLDKQEWDNWIEYFKQRLIELENYELVKDLHL